MCTMLKLVVVRTLQLGSVRSWIVAFLKLEYEPPKNAKDGEGGKEGVEPSCGEGKHVSMRYVYVLARKGCSFWDSSILRWSKIANFCFLDARFLNSTRLDAWCLVRFWPRRNVICAEHLHLESIIYGEAHTSRVVYCDLWLAESHTKNCF